MHHLPSSLMLLTVVVAAPALAQTELPTRVGRVSFVSGNLAFHMAGQSEWSAAAVNYPVATGASLWVDAGARGEIRIGPSTIDMASNTELDVAALNERVTQLNVPQGRIYFHLRRLDEGQSVEIDIPGGAVPLLQPGYYDIDAGSQDQPSRVAVFEGSARFVGSGADIAVKAGDVAVLNGVSPVTATLEPAVADAFVEWCRSRDYDEKRLAAPYHVSPNMTGYVELDEYGRWDTAPAYGEVWYPKVPAGWVPYTNGAWAWVEPWGWTWIDAEPWGFAPCHYGRWALIGESWGWVPGTFEPFPVYAPALVGFLGGPGVGLYLPGAVGPQVGWFPLAPGEVYWPSYTSDPRYIRSLNRANVAGIDSIHIPRDGVPPVELARAAFVNRRFATIVPQHVFTSAGKVNPAELHPAAGTLEHAPVTMRPPQIRPASTRGVPGPTTYGARGHPAPLAGTPRADAGPALGPASVPAGMSPAWHTATAPGPRPAMSPHSVAEQRRPLALPSGEGERWPGIPGHLRQREALSPQSVIPHTERQPARPAQPAQMHAFREPPQVAHLPQPPHLAARASAASARPPMHAFRGPPQVAHLPQPTRPGAPAPAHAGGPPHGGGAPPHGSPAPTHGGGHDEHHG